MNSAATIWYLKKGDESVFKDIYFEHYQKVYAYVLKKTGSSFLAEEVLQLSFLKLWNYRHHLDENIPLISQVFRIARTTMIEQVRNEQLRKRSVKGFIQSKDSPVFSKDNAQEKLEENELQRALSGLLEKCR